VKYIVVGLIAGITLAGCLVDQLSEFKKLEGARDEAALEKKTVPAACFADGAISAECGQLAEIQGRACLTLATQETTAGAACPPPSDTALPRLQCAARDFAVAVKGTGFSAEDRNDFAEMRARALYCGATLGVRLQGLPDVREAARELETLPANPERDQLAAATELYVANTEELSGADRCEGARLAVQRADRGLQGGATGDLQAGLTATRTHAMSVASRLDGCRVP
jgi:hypothetical protein